MSQFELGSLDEFLISYTFTEISVWEDLGSVPAYGICAYRMYMCDHALWVRRMGIEDTFTSSFNFC